MTAVILCAKEKREIKHLLDVESEGNPIVSKVLNMCYVEIRLPLINGNVSGFYFNILLGGPWSSCLQRLVRTLFRQTARFGGISHAWRSLSYWSVFPMYTGCVVSQLLQYFRLSCLLIEAKSSRTFIKNLPASTALKSISIFCNVRTSTPIHVLHNYPTFIEVRKTS